MPEIVAGQPQMYAGTEDAPGGGKRLLFVQTHGQVPIHICISGQDYGTLLRDGSLSHHSVHSEDWCGEECDCFQAGREREKEPPDRI